MGEVATVEVLGKIPFDLDVASLLVRLHLPEGSEDAGELAALVEAVLPHARPKAICKESYVEGRADTSVTIDGVTFDSRVLRANLDGVERVFPYIATCGTEIDELNLPAGDFLKQFWIDTIKEILLGCACTHLDEYLRRRYALGRTSSMSPGSGDVAVWPIEQQTGLFSLLGNVRELVGVDLTESCLMVPNKTVSGIKFPTEVDFRSCQVCHREKCPSRSAPFDRDLWQRCHHEAAGDT